jgi:hypothetical protein
MRWREALGGAACVREGAKRGSGGVRRGSLKGERGIEGERARARERERERERVAATASAPQAMMKMAAGGMTMTDDELLARHANGPAGPALRALYDRLCPLLERPPPEATAAAEAAEAAAAEAARAAGLDPAALKAVRSDPAFQAERGREGGRVGAKRERERDVLGSVCV